MVSGQIVVCRYGSIGTWDSFLLLQDPVYTTSSGEWNEIPDPDWLVRLREVVHAAQYGGDTPAQYVGDTAAQYGIETASQATSLAYDPSQVGSALFLYASSQKFEIHICLVTPRNIGWAGMRPWLKGNWWWRLIYEWKTYFGIAKTNNKNNVGISWGMSQET
jgi:hypothetical protein